MFDPGHALKGAKLFAEKTIIYDTLYEHRLYFTSARRAAFATMCIVDLLVNGDVEEPFFG